MEPVSKINPTGVFAMLQHNLAMLNASSTYKQNLAQPEKNAQINSPTVKVGGIIDVKA